MVSVQTCYAAVLAAAVDLVQRRFDLGLALLTPLAKPLGQTNQSSRREQRLRGNKQSTQHVQPELGGCHGEPALGTIDGKGSR